MWFPIKIYFSKRGAEYVIGQKLNVHDLEADYDFLVRRTAAIRLASPRLGCIHDMLKSRHTRQRLG